VGSPTERSSERCKDTRDTKKGEARHEEGNRSHWSFEWLRPSVRNALAQAGHTVYASMRNTAGRNAPQAANVKKFAHDNKVDLRPIELDVSSEKSIEAAIRQIVAEPGRFDVLMHNAGHMVFGPAEAFTPEQLAELYDINVLSAQRVNRVALP
jgi:NAD(P)-dependent dehydrogenase (short-subunit alcohol dehydrogenase family)